MQAHFIEVNCESSFFLFTIGDDGHKSLGAFPRILSVPPEVISILIAESAGEKGHGTLRDTEGF